MIDNVLSMAVRFLSKIVFFLFLDQFQISRCGPCFESGPNPKIASLWRQGAENPAPAKAWPNCFRVPISKGTAQVNGGLRPWAKIGAISCISCADSNSNFGFDDMHEHGKTEFEKCAGAGRGAWERVGHN
jgi:hypothetical protein